MLEWEEYGEIDFDTSCLVIFAFSEGSGSIGISLDEPTVEENIGTVRINRNVPEMGTADMAFYALFFEVDKSLTKVIFDNGVKRITIPLDPSSPITETLVETEESKSNLNNESSGDGESSGLNLPKDLEPLDPSAPINEAESLATPNAPTSAAIVASLATFYVLANW